MKVIMKQTLPKVGKEGEVVNVADGFARNFLFPKGLARMADKANLALLDRNKEKLAVDAEKTRGAAEKTAEKLNGATIRIVGQTAKGSTRLFGAVTSQDIADAINDQLKVELSKRSVALMHPIKRLGVHSVLIDLHRAVDARVTVEVADETGFLGVETLEETKPAEEVVTEAAAEATPAEAPPAETEPLAAE